MSTVQRGCGKERCRRFKTWHRHLVWFQRREAFLNCQKCSEWKCTFTEVSGKTVTWLSSPEDSKEQGAGCREIWKHKGAEMTHEQMGTGNDHSAVLVRTEETVGRGAQTGEDKRNGNLWLTHWVILDPCVWIYHSSVLDLPAKKDYTFISYCSYFWDKKP